MGVAGSGPVADWQVRGSYFEGCNCEAICPCRSVGGRPGGPSSFGECFGALSWYIQHGHADGLDLSGLRTVLSIRYLDRVQPSTPWEVVLYVDAGASDQQRAALADIFLGRAGGTVARLYGPAIGEVCAVRPARIILEHTAARKRIDVVGYLRVEAEGDASDPGDVRCGIPGFDHPGTELHRDALRSTDPALRWEVRDGATPPSPPTSTTAPAPERGVSSGQAAPTSSRYSRGRREVCLHLRRLLRLRSG